MRVFFLMACSLVGESWPRVACGALWVVCVCAVLGDGVESLIKVGR